MKKISLVFLMLVGAGMVLFSIGGGGFSFMRFAATGPERIYEELRKEARTNKELNQILISSKSWNWESTQPSLDCWKDQLQKLSSGNGELKTTATLMATMDQGHPLLIVQMAQFDQKGNLKMEVDRSFALKMGPMDQWLGSCHANQLAQALTSVEKAGE